MDSFYPDSEEVDMRIELERARRSPHVHRLSDLTRERFQEDYRVLKSLGCNGPLVAAIARALALDAEARNVRA